MMSQVICENKSAVLLHYTVAQSVFQLLALHFLQSGHNKRCNADGTAFNGTVCVMVRLEIAIPMPFMQKVQCQIFVVPPYEDYLIFFQQIQNEFLQLQCLCASII